MQRRGSRLIKAFITMSSTSVSSGWSPTQITNSGSTLEWTVSNGVTIAKTTINDPTFDFSGNTGTADILIEKVDGLAILSIPDLSLKALNVSNYKELTILSCTGNSISTLDVSTNTELTHLNCQDNSISTLNVSNNTELTYLRCYGNYQAPSITDQIFMDLDANEKSNGELEIRNNRTSASDAARANLITKGWLITDDYTS